MTAEIRRPRFAKFPVFFPVSRELRRRRVRSRLHPQPASLNCRETLRLSSENRRKSPQYAISARRSLARRFQYGPVCSVSAFLASFMAQLKPSESLSQRSKLLTVHFVQLRLHPAALARHLEFGEEGEGLFEFVLLGSLVALSPHQQAPTPIAIAEDRACCPTPGRCRQGRPWEGRKRTILQARRNRPQYRLSAARTPISNRDALRTRRQRHRYLLGTARAASNPATAGLSRYLRK